jgi:hypothetical protein
MLFVFILEAELATDDRPIRGDGTLVNSTPNQIISVIFLRNVIYS